MGKHALIMRKFKQFIKLIISPVQCIYMLMVNQDSKFATNTVTFVTEFFPLWLKYTVLVVTDLRSAFTVEIKGLTVGILPQLFLK